MCRSAAAAAAAGGYRGFLGAVVEAAAPRLGTFGGMLSRERYEGMRERLECITRLDDMDFLDAMVRLPPICTARGLGRGAP